MKDYPLLIVGQFFFTENNFKALDTTTNILLKKLTWLDLMNGRKPLDAGTDIYAMMERGILVKPK